MMHARMILRPLSKASVSDAVVVIHCCQPRSVICLLRGNSMSETLACLVWLCRSECRANPVAAGCAVSGFRQTVLVSQAIPAIL